MRCAGNVEGALGAQRLAQLSSASGDRGADFGGRILYSQAHFRCYDHVFVCRVSAQFGEWCAHSMQIACDFLGSEEEEEEEEI